MKSLAFVKDFINPLNFHKKVINPSISSMISLIHETCIESEDNEDDEELGAC
jgi:hypothetical protein